MCVGWRTKGVSNAAHSAAYPKKLRKAWARAVEMAKVHGPAGPADAYHTATAATADPSEESGERDKLDDGQDWSGAEAAFDKGVAAIGPQTVGTDADLDVFAKLANEPQKHAHLLSAEIYGVESADTLFVDEDGLERADQADVLLAERLLLQYERELRRQGQEAALAP